MDPDAISCWVLKECAKELSKPLNVLMQDCQKQRKQPESWKRADIVLLFKKGNRQNPLNHRPVSLASLVCKVMERIVWKNWVDHIKGSKLLSDKQFGFRKGRSYASNLLSYYTKITEKTKR